jgi:hypothetical protein
MANAFKSFKNNGITTETIVYTGPALTQSTVIGLSIANTSGTPSYVSVKLNTTHMVMNAPVVNGGALVVIGGDQKVVVEPTDTISVISDNIVDVIISVLEIS